MSMKRELSIWQSGVIGGAGAVLVWGLLAGASGFLASPGAQAAAPHSPGWMTPPPTWNSQTPPPTWQPMGTRTPPPTWQPMATRTPPPTWQPMGTRTPPPTWPPPMTGTPPPNWTPPPTPNRTPPPPPPLALRPRVQFGHAAPGTSIDYGLVLLNHLAQSTDVTLGAHSFGGWPVTVDPSQVTVQPGVSNTLAVHVDVPISPSLGVDVERVVGVTAAGTPITATAALVTIARRHPFTDLPAGSWPDDAVQYLVAQRVVSGYADGGFHPYEYVTRAQFAKLLVGAHGWALASPARPTFSDVPATFWGYGYIETAVAHNVIAGYPDGTFHPNALLTRAQLAKMVALARGWTPPDTFTQAFVDVNATDWFAGYVSLASDAAIMSGYQDATFRPAAPATRAQVAKIVTLSLFSDPTP